MAQGLPKGFAPNEKEPNFLQSIGVIKNLMKTEYIILKFLMNHQISAKNNG